MPHSESDSHLSEFILRVSTTLFLAKTGVQLKYYVICKENIVCLIKRFSQNTLFRKVFISVAREVLEVYKQRLLVILTSTEYLHPLRAFAIEISLYLFLSQPINLLCRYLTDLSPSRARAQIRYFVRAGDTYRNLFSKQLTFKAIINGASLPMRTTSICWKLCHRDFLKSILYHISYF